MPESALPAVYAPTTGLSLGRCLAVAASWYVVVLALVLLTDALLPGASRLTQAAFTHWDAAHYLYIRDHGYDAQRTAFFPLFPFLWRALGLPPIQMGLANGLLFALSFAGLAWQFGWSLRQQVLLLAVPSLLFMGLPFSEAVFFAGSVLVLIGLRREQLGIYCLGLLVCCLGRAVAITFLPAIVATAVLTRRHWRHAVWTAGAASSAALLGIGLSMLVQHSAGHRWFAFLEAQKLWDTRLRWPGWPLHNWGGDFASLFEAPSFAVGLACLVGLAALAWRHWRQPLPAATRAPLIFSLAYLAAVTLIVVFTKGGALVSLSRYVYATAFFAVSLAAVVERRLSSRQLLTVFVGLELLWLALFSATNHIRTLLQFSGVSLLVLLWLANAHASQQVRRLVLGPTALSGIGLLLLLLFRFLNNLWVA